MPNPSAIGVTLAKSFILMLNLQHARRVPVASPLSGQPLRPAPTEGFN